MTRLASLWRAPILLHLAGLGAVLIALLPLVRPGPVFFSDEGAPILQERLLRVTHSWVEPASPLPHVDPRGVARTIPNADAGAKGRAPYAKHPLYPLTLGLLDRMFGTGGVLGVSIAGTLLSALAAAGIASMVDAHLARPALWIAGLASPLAFDSYIAVGHTIGAAFAALSAVGLMAIIQRRSWRWAALALVGVGVAATTMFRTEGALWGGAVAVTAALLVAFRRTAAPLVTSAAGVASVVSVFVVRRAEARLLLRHVGAGQATLSGPDVSSHQGFALQRLHGVARTVFAPGYQANSREALLLGAAATLVGLAAVLARRAKTPDHVTIALVVAALLSAARLLFGSPAAVPGLVVAFPLGLFALLLLSNDDVRSDGQVALLSCVLAFGAAVVGTQYAKGGGVEWGGRYFAIGLPVAAVVVAGVLRRYFVTVPRPAMTAQVAALAATVASLSLLAILTLGRTHAATRQLGQVLVAADPGSGASSPTVVLTTERFVPQIEWQLYHRFIWLTPKIADLPEIARSLEADAPGRVLLLTAAPDSALPAIARSWRAGPRRLVPKAPGVEVIALEPMSPSATSRGA